MNNILFVFAATENGVRLQKFAKFLSAHSYKLKFIGWLRYKNQTRPKDTKFETIDYLIKGGGEANKKLPGLYLCFLFKLFFKLLFRKNLSKELVFAINFESAYIVYLVSHFRKVTYVYDIWDEFAISHKFPSKVVNCLKKIDKRIRKKSAFYIHVDEKRLSSIESDNYIIVYNSPYDIYGNAIHEVKYENAFAVTGWLNNIRGLDSIYKFASSNPQIQFVVAGEFIDSTIKDKYLALKNVQYYHFMPQNELFDKIKNCRGIFSLYDPSLEINRLAASNKLYDAMMLAVPSVVNSEIAAAKTVKDAQIGYLVNYVYDETWDQLSKFDIDETTRLGQNGRKEYLSNYEFDAMMKRVFLPKVETLFNK